MMKSLIGLMLCLVTLSNASAQQAELDSAIAAQQAAMASAYLAESYQNSTNAQEAQIPFMLNMVWDSTARASFQLVLDTIKQTPTVPWNQGNVDMNNGNDHLGKANFAMFVYNNPVNPAEKAQAQFVARQEALAAKADYVAAKAKYDAAAASNKLKFDLLKSLADSIALWISQNPRPNGPMPGPMPF